MPRIGLLWGLVPLLLFSCAHSTRRESPFSPPSAGGTQARTCRPLTEQERQRVLSIADPSNFPTTRYRKGANGLHATDCSHFVHEVYKQAGLPYGFRPTAELGNAREFDLLPEKDARPGDLMLFRGHVGIVDENGKIISALYRRHHRKSSIASIDRRYFKTFHGQRYVLRYRCPPAEAASNRTLATEKKKP